MGRVEGKIAIVTGASKGIGRACAERLAAEGAEVVMTDIDVEVGHEACEAVARAGGRAVFARQDTTSEADWRSVIETISRRFGALHILVNNAGVAVIGPIVETTLEDWRRQQAVNVEGVFLGLKHALPLMRSSGGGSIVNISSLAGLIGAPNMSAYCASKGAVRLLTKAAAMECAALRDGVRINSVHPGIIETDIWTAMASPGEGANRPDLDVIAEVSTPLGAKGYPSDVADGVLYLASGESRYVTGTELVIDGGMFAR